MSNVFLFASPKFRPLDDAGEIMPNCYLQFYLTQSTTPEDVYADAALGTPLSNPVDADATGLFPFIYMDPTITYRVQLYDQNDVLVWDVDPYTPPRDYAPGTVLMFMGTSIQLEAAYPAALWQVCDGTNGTYDLRGRLPIGVSSDIDPGEQVGTEGGTYTTTAAGTHDHTGSTGGTAISSSQMPSHTHLIAATSGVSNNSTIDGSTILDADTPFGGDSQYRLRQRAGAAIAGLTSSTGSGATHLHSISTEADHTHDVTVGLPPATGVWWVMRRFP